MARKRTHRQPTLYHYTSVEHWESMKRDGVIRPTVPNLRPPTSAEVAEMLATQGRVQREAGSPSVVWLTDDPEPGHGHDHGLSDPKRAVRLTVDAEAERWRQWAHRQRNAVSDWLDVMNATGGGKGSRWFVHVGSIRLGRVLEARDMSTGLLLTVHGVPVTRLAS